MNGYTPSSWAQPMSHNGGIQAAGYNKKGMYMLESNRLALGNYNDMMGWLLKCEKDVFNELLKNKIEHNHKWDKMPFK